MGAIAELAENNVSLSAAPGELATDKATGEVEKLISLGHILPSQKDAMLELRLTNHEMFLPVVSKTPLVKLSHEEGTTPPDTQPDLDVDAETPSSPTAMAPSTSSPTASPDATI